MAVGGRLAIVGVAVGTVPPNPHAIPANPRMTVAARILLFIFSHSLIIQTKNIAYIALIFPLV
jgi:hypothetical protein